MSPLASPSKPSQPKPSETRNQVTVPTPDHVVETIVLDVEGMMCAGCVSSVEKKLAQCEGVTKATVNLVTEVAAVDCLPSADPHQIAQALTEAGYPSTLRQTKGLSDNPGLQAETDWLQRKEAAQKNQTTQLAIAGTLLLLSTLGHLQHLSFASSSPFKAWLELPIISTLWFHSTLATLTQLFPARTILIEGFQGIQRKSPNMNTLVSLGALSAYVTSLAALVFPSLGWECFFDEPVMLLSFILIGRSLEQRAQFQAARSLRALISLQPTLARLTINPSSSSSTPSTIEQPTDVKIPASQVQIGEWLRVLPGEKVPVDGTITTGETTLDESMITGESIPVSKRVGDDVIAGTLNQSGAITLQVSRTGANTTLGQMIQLVETAQTRKAPIQGLADLISGYFTYCVLACALLTFCFWYFIGVPLWPEVARSTMGHLHHAHHASAQAMSHSAITSATMADGLSQSFRLLVSLKLAIAVIVVACPCALGLATPTAILVGSGIGAEQGLLIRGGDVLEATHKLNTLVFDKTGTLTTGKPSVTDVLPLNDEVSPDQLLQIAATVETGTQHPLALAIQQAAKAKKCPLLPADHFHTKAGFGISAVLINETNQQSTPTYLGKAAWMTQNGCPIDEKAANTADLLAKSGKTVVFVGQREQVLGLIGVTDTLRPESIGTIAAIQDLGIQVQILSGDRTTTVNAIAQQLNLSPDQAHGEVSPEGKLNEIDRLQRSGDRVGIVGDGINDAPALSQADVGIALGSGTEVAMETADIVLMGNSITGVLAAIRLSQNTCNTIRQNLAWAFAYNLICIPLAGGAFLPAFGLSLNPGFAGGLMALSSVTVVINSLLLRLRT